MTWFANLKISTKLLGSFVIVAAIAAVIGWMGLSTSAKMAAVSSDVHKNHLISMRELLKANHAFLSARIAIRDSLLTSSPAERQKKFAQVVEALDQADNYMAEYKKAELSEPEQKLLPSSEAALRNFRKQAESIETVAVKMQDQAAVEILHGVAGDAAREAAESLDQLAEINSQLAADNNEANERTAARAQTTILTFIGVGVLIALSLGFVISRVISRPVRKLGEAADQLATGVVDLELPAEDRSEVGQLSRSFKAMGETIRDRSVAAQKIAGGDLSVVVEPKSDRDVLANSLKKCVEVLNELMRQMANMAQQHDAGEIDSFLDTANFEGDYGKVAQGINDMVSGHIAVKKKAMACVGEFGRGNFEAPLEKFPGKKAFINETIEQVRANLKALIADADMLVRAAIEGRLDTRADATKHHGDFRKIVDGVNETLNTIVGPLNIAIDSLDRLAQGENPEPITRDYQGEYKRLKESVNAVTCTVKTRGEEMNYLLSAALEGNLDARADARKFTGGNAKLIDGINGLLEAIVHPLRDASQVLEKIAAGDLTAEVEKPYKGEFNNLKHAINTVSIQVRQAMQQIGRSTSALVMSAEELNKVSHQMSSSADETAAQANVVSAASDQVSKNVQTVATGADEMGASIKEIAKNTAEATKVAISAVKTAEATNETIEKLGQSSAEIGQVIKVITSIAQQTNLLALNATIEAARAGEAGKGFAVVANEVKELAKETAKATEDISRKIEAIQTDTKGAVAAIGQIGGVIHQINDIQNTIASAVEEQSATTNEISRNLAEAAKGAVDITKNISGVAEAARSTTAGAVDTQKSAQSLERMAAELQELVSQFKYDEQKATATARPVAAKTRANGKYVASEREGAFAEAIH
ncbi:MAG TPA: methyl-accepting chemotaxis protein [Terriglobales bacterium]|nr:methyl-accepting chemotaxis protein [Terriglobales bacterium]